MWGYNRFNRPSWAVGLFITLGCLTGIFAGILVFIEGKKVKKAEGIPVHEYDVLESIEEYQARKAKDDEKLAKKESKHAEKEEKKAAKNGGAVGGLDGAPEIGIERRRTGTAKVKGDQWFTRH